MKVENLEHIQKIRDARGLNRWDNMDNICMSRKVRTIRRTVINKFLDHLSNYKLLQNVLQGVSERSIAQFLPHVPQNLHIQKLSILLTESSCGFLTTSCDYFISSNKFESETQYVYYKVWTEFFYYILTNTKLQRFSLWWTNGALSY
jgi:hypothetical protein